MSLLNPPGTLSSLKGIDLQWSILLTLAYADVFDFPLTVAETHRYLIGRAADYNAVATALDQLARTGQVEAHHNYFSLPERSELSRLREHRAAIAARLWKHAVRYGRMLAALPFVRLVAVSGALAMDNTDENGDVDYFIVTAPGRLWLARAMSILLVRIAAHDGVTLCPNYFVTTRALALSDRNLFSAHELAQMVPLSGSGLYRRMRQLNDWTKSYLPNAEGPPRAAPAEGYRSPPLTWLEQALGWPVFDSLERWEMERKVRKFRRLGSDLEDALVEPREVIFGRDCCKGHLDRHGARALRAFETRVLALKETWP